MKKFGILIVAAAAAAAFCSPLAAQDEIDPLEETVAAVEKEAAAEIAVEDLKPAEKEALKKAESRPAAKAEARPAPKPAPVIPVWDSRTGAPEAEWEFLRTFAAGDDKSVLQELLPQLGDWLARNPQHTAAPDAQLLKAGLQEKLGNYDFALLSLLKHLSLYPGSSSFEEAKKSFSALLERKGDKKTRPALEKLAAAPETASADFNLSALLRELSAQAGGEYYGALLDEYRYFFNRFPLYPGNDELRLALADLHAAEKKYLAASLCYEKIVKMHPSTPLLARVKLSLARTLDDNMREYDRAIAVYKDIAAGFPGTDQAWAAYMRLPELAEKQKQYKLAVETYEKVIELYPSEKEEVYSAYREEARVLRDRLDSYHEAVAVFNRIADVYPGERSVTALTDAAEVCRKKLKDSACEVKSYERLAKDNPQSKEAPEALYEAGEIFFKDKNVDRARDYYQKILELYPASSVSKKAEKRVAAIISGKF